MMITLRASDIFCAILYLCDPSLDSNDLVSTLNNFKKKMVIDLSSSPLILESGGTSPLLYRISINKKPEAIEL